MSDLEQVVRWYRQEGGDKRCWEKARGAAPPPLRARVTVSLDVRRDGKVGIARAVRDDAATTDLASCMVAWTKTWRFPASEGETHMSVPFRFVAP